MKILIVEDEKGIAELIKDFLNDEIDSIEYFFAENGLDASNICEEHQFDVIITDYSMPILNGKEFLSTTRGNNGKNVETPVLFITGRFPEMDEEITSWKKVFFIQKPFDAKQLLYYVKCSLKKAS